VFPPAYLLSFVVDHNEEPLHRAADMSLYFRSRMQGTLGLSFKNEGFSESDLTMMANEIVIYKAMRATIGAASATLLSPQAQTTNGPAWDVLQELVAGAEQLLVTAVQSDVGVHYINVKPARLEPGATYDVQSVESGLLGTATGADLMANGIDLLQSPASAAHVLVITAQNATATLARKRP
jgi:hypothetical protein